MYSTYHGSSGNVLGSWQFRQCSWERNIGFPLSHPSQISLDPSMEGILLGAIVSLLAYFSEFQMNLSACSGWPRWTGGCTGWLAGWLADASPSPSISAPAPATAPQPQHQPQASDPAPASPSQAGHRPAICTRPWAGTTVEGSLTSRNPLVGPLLIEGPRSRNSGALPTRREG